MCQTNKGSKVYLNKLFICHESEIRFYRPDLRYSVYCSIIYVWYIATFFWELCGSFFYISLSNALTSNTLSIIESGNSHKDQY